MNTSTSTTGSTPDATTAATEIRLGRGVAAPDGATATTVTSGTTPVASPGLRRWHRIGLATAALVSPLAMGAQYAFDRTGLPRQDAEIYLTAVANNQVTFVASTAAYTLAVLTSLAGAVVLALVCGRRSPVLTTIAVVGTTVGAVAAGAFIGLRLAALALTPAGAVRPDGAEVFGWLQAAIIDPVGFLLLAAIVGMLATVATLVRSRRLLGWWVAPIAVLGVVMTSGEFSFWIGGLGGMAQAAAVVPLVRELLRPTA
jgi:hypothetical protein